MRQSHRREPTKSVAKGPDHVERGRKLYEQCAWAAAYRALSLADQQTPLQPDDLERLSTAAYLVGRDEEYLGLLERAHNAHLNTGECPRAIRCAFWLAFHLLMRGETGRASGWLARAQRLLKQEANDCAERGYLLLPTVVHGPVLHDCEAAYADAAEAAAIGERCGDPDLVACARMEQGRIRLQQGQVEAGLALLDETMLAVATGELSPLVTGLMYCSVIAACQQVYALDRTFEWTAALAHWCDGQPDMVAFAGTCQVHRAEIMQFRGAWQNAIEEARRVCTRSQGVSQRTAAAAFYRMAEVHRLKGDFVAAEKAYRAASRLGLEPQPGLALLRLAQGRIRAAATAVRRVANTTADALERLGLLPACIEIMLAAGEVQEARDACRELEEIARAVDTGVPGAIAAEACGAVDLAEGNPLAALGSLRQAFEVWHRINAPYAAARVRVLMGLACHALGDEDGEILEIDAARSTFEQLGAAPDLDRIDLLIGRVPVAHAYRLTPRELQVLRLVAAGDTNKAIAAELRLSERTIERHLSNIFNKLDLSTRAAATAWVYEHDLI
jgi:DNA-binding CsgD family transcriptional regulator